jgi:CRISPR type II-A/NMEMI-associated protein Csn2
MKLVHPDYQMQIQFVEGEIISLVIESEQHFFKYIYELYGQFCGREGRLVLSEAGNILKINKYVDFINNPFSININQKNVINKVYALLKEQILTSEEIENFYKINSDIVNLIESIGDTLNLPIKYEAVEDITTFFKFMSVELMMDEADSLVEKLTEYVKVIAQVLGVKVIILANMIPYLNNADLQYIKKIAEYEKVTVLLIDNYEKEGYNFYDAKYIIDADLCEII